MAVKDRRSGKRNWVPGLFAGFWVLLAVFSGAYLFRIITDPATHRAETAAASPSAASATPSPEPGAHQVETTSASAAPAAPSLSPAEADALLRADDTKDRELAELKSQLRDLSGQVSDLNTRLKPLEKVLGPVAALPSSASVTTSMPSPEPMQPAEQLPEPPKPETKAVPPAAPMKPSEPPKAAEKPPIPAKPAEQAKAPETPPAPPKPAEKPVEQAKAPQTHAAQDDADEAPSPSASDSERSISADEPSPHSVATPGSKDQKVTSNEPASTPSTESADTANLSAPPPIPPGTTRFGIEIGSVDKQDKVRPMWRDLLSNHAALVAGLQARRIIAPDKKWRLIAGPFSSAAEAMQACALFKKASMPCEATVFAGDAL